MNRHLRAIDVVVARRRRIAAQGRLVAGDRARHAKARVGVDVVGADQALRELVEDVVVLGEQLAGDVERDAVRAVLRDAARELVGSLLERCVPRDALARARERMRKTRAHRLRRRGEVQRAPLAAEHAAVGGMIGIAAHAGDAAVLVLDHDAAADAAIRARRARLASTSGEVDVHDAAFDLRRKSVARTRRPARPPRPSQARSTSCAADTRRGRRTRCPATAARPCAGTGRARANTRSSAVRNTATLPSG